MGVRHPAGTAYSIENNSIADMATGRVSRGDTRHYENDTRLRSATRPIVALKVGMFSGSNLYV